MTAREIIATTLAEVTGRTAVEVEGIMARCPVPIPHKEFSQEESAKMLADFREEKAGILNWLIEGARQQYEMMNH